MTQKRWKSCSILRNGRARISMPCFGLSVIFPLKRDIKIFRNGCTRRRETENFTVQSMERAILRIIPMNFSESVMPWQFRRLQSTVIKMTSWLMWNLEVWDIGENGIPIRMKVLSRFPMQKYAGIMCWIIPITFIMQGF